MKNFSLSQLIPLLEYYEAAGPQSTRGPRGKPRCQSEGREENPAAPENSRENRLAYLAAKAVWIAAQAWAGVAVPARMVWTASFTAPPTAGGKAWSR